MRGTPHEVGHVTEAALPKQLVAVGDGVAYVAGVVGVGAHGDDLAAQLMEGSEDVGVVGGGAGVVEAGVDLNAPAGLDGARRISRMTS